MEYHNFKKKMHAKMRLSEKKSKLIFDKNYENPNDDGKRLFYGR